VVYNQTCKLCGYQATLVQGSPESHPLFAHVCRSQDPQYAGKVVMIDLQGHHAKYPHSKVYLPVETTAA
jgi:hypothetical protein